MAGTEQRSKPISSGQRIAVRISHGLCLLIFVLVITWANMSSDNNGLGGLTASNIFAWHPVFMTVGMVCVFAQAALAYRAYPFGKKTNKLIHMVLQAIAVILISLGLWSVFKYHNDSLIANLYSTHSWLGVATVCLFFQNFGLGFGAFWLPYAPQWARAAYLPAHVYLGVLTFFSAVLTVCTGITEKNAWLGCSYDIDSVDTNPASHYWDIPSGCRVSSWLAICTLLLLISTGVAVMNLGVGEKPQQENDKTEAFIKGDALAGSVEA